MLPATNFNGGRAVGAEVEAADAPAVASATRPAAPAAATAARPSFRAFTMEPPRAFGRRPHEAGLLLVRRPGAVTKLIKVRWQSCHRKSLESRRRLILDC